MIALVLVQLMLPLVLIGWVLWWPLRSWAGVAIQISAIGLYLIAFAFIGLWTVLPWWTPCVLGLMLAATCGGTLHARRRPWRPASLLEWAAVGMFTLLGAAATWLMVTALHGRVAPAGRVVELGMPLEPGRYLVVNGGNHALINAHLKTLDDEVPRFRKWRGQSYGIDLVGLNAAGFRAGGLRPADPSAYAIHGAGVIAPCSGTVVAVTDGLADNVVPHVDREHMAGNHITLACSGVEVVLGHLLDGSIVAAPGAKVTQGDQLAAVGNSGNSDEPHLHVHAQIPGTMEEPFSGRPLPILVEQRYLVRNQRISR